ncbi:MAG: hypothetical protein AB7O62_02430 [Pirellulales bacterium]
MSIGQDATRRMACGMAWARLAAIGGLLLPVQASAQPIAVQRLQRTQPLLQMTTDFPVGRVQRLAFSEDRAAGKLWLYAAGEDKQIYRWEVQQQGGRMSLTPVGRTSWPIFRDIRGIIYGFDVFHRAGGEPLLAFGGMGVKTPQVQLVDLANPDSQLTLLYNDNQTKILGDQAVYDVDFSADGQRLAVGYGGQSRLVVWDVSQGARQVPKLPSATTMVIPTKLDVVRGVKLDSRGARLAVGGTDAQGWLVEVWDLTGAAPKKTQTKTLGRAGPTYAGMAWTRGNANNEQWVTAVGKELILAGGGSTATLSFNALDLGASADGQRLAILGQSALVLCRGSGEVERQLDGAPQGATAVTLSPDGAFVAAAGVEQVGGIWSHQIKLWRADRAEPAASIPSPEKAAAVGAPIVQVALIEKDRLNDRVAFSWGEAAPGATLQREFQLIGRSQIVNSQAKTAAPAREFMSDGIQTFLAEKGGRDPWGPVPRLTGDLPLCFAIKDDLLALGYPKGTVVCKLSSVKANLNTYKNMSSNAEKVRRGKQLADQSIIRGFYGHSGKVNCLAFAKNAGWLVSGAEDGTISAWSMDGAIPRSRHGEFGAPLQGHPNGKDVFVSADPDSNTPAWQCGLRKGQFLSKLEIDGVAVAKGPGMVSALVGAAPGSVVYLEGLTPTGQAGKFEKFSAKTPVNHEALWTFYPQQDGNWWIATPQGRFDASSACLPRMEVHVNADNKLSMDQPRHFPAPWRWSAKEFLNLLHNKAAVKLLDDVISSKKTEEPLDLILPPQLEIRLAGANPTQATFSARAVDEPIHSVSLWVNSRRIDEPGATPRGDVAETSREISAKIDPRLLRAKHNILTGVALVETKNGLIARNTIITLPDGQLQPGGRKLHFLGIGVTDFRKEQINAELKKKNERSGGLQTLQYTHNDVIRLGEALAASIDHPRWKESPLDAYSLGYFATLTSTEATTFETDPKTGPVARPAAEHPTEANIREQFAALSQAAGPEDLAVVMFAGHGLGGDGSAFKFVAQDTSSINPQVGLNDSAIESLLGGLPCRTLLLLDSCHSGEESSRQQLRNWPGLSAGPMVLPACDADESSLEHPRYLHGLFSQTLLEALTGTRARIPKNANPPALPIWDTNDDGWLSVKELCEYARARTPKLCLEAPGKAYNPKPMNSITFQDADEFRLMPAHPQ